MLTAATIKSLAQRLEKAEALVAAAAVTPVAGCDGLYVVTNGDGTQVYLARLEIGRESCSCEDFQRRQGPAGQPCKHLLASQLYAQQPDRRPRAPQPATDPKAALAMLQGDPEDADPYPVRAA